MPIANEGNPEAGSTGPIGFAALLCEDYLQKYVKLCRFLGIIYHML